MPQFIKKSALVYAIQFTGVNQEEVSNFMGTVPGVSWLEAFRHPGNWLVRDNATGNISVHTDTAFKRMYLPVEETKTQKQES